MGSECGTYLGVVPPIGLSNAFRTIREVIQENNNHTNTNLHQRFFNDKPRGITHIASNVISWKITMGYIRYRYIGKMRLTKYDL